MTKIKNYLLLALLLALPWQTRLIYKSVYIQDKFWEYGSLFLYGTEILSAILIIFWIVDRLRDKNFCARLEVLNIKRVMAIVGVYLIFVFYFFISSNRDLAWQYLNWMIYTFCLVIIVLVSKLSFYKISLFAWLGGLVPAFFGINQFFTRSISANKWLGVAAQNPSTIGVSVIENLGERWLRAYGSFGSPNALGIYLGIIFLLGVILVLNTHNRKAHLALLFGQLVILSALFLSFSRGAYLAVLIGLVVLFFQNRKNILFFQQLGLYALLFITMLSIFSNLIFTRVDFSNRLEIKSVSERVTQWQDFKAIFAGNVLFGVGPGNYPVALHALHPQASANYFSPVHNIFLLFIGQFGIVGFWFVIYTTHLLYKKWFKKIKIFAPLVGILVAGIFDHWTLSMFTGWMFFGLILALGLKDSYIDTLA